MEVTDKDLEYIVKENMGQYSTYVLLSRAIPDFRDGLKPSYRRLLWAMQTMKAVRFTKSANIAGETMRYHPHGTTYPTAVGMAQVDGQLNPLIIGKGNFGKHSSELAYASDRYTEMKLSDIAIKMMSDVKKDGVNMIDNYDGTRKMPEVFPVNYPSILAYAQSGIGVGFSSSIPSFNTTELCNYTIELLKGNEPDFIIPDFGTGAYIVKDDEVVKNINENGSGSLVQRAKVKLDKDKREIIVKEIPYNTTLEKIIERIIKLNKEEKLKEVAKVEDTSGLKGFEFVITAKRGIDLDQLLEKLYQLTPMQSTFSANMMVINKYGLPEKMGVKSLVEMWVEWRTEVLVKMLTREIKNKKVHLEVLEGLSNIKDDLEEVIKVIRSSTDDNVLDNLMKNFDLTPLQAERVSGLKLRNLTTTFIKKQLESINDVISEIQDLETTKNSDKLLKVNIIEDLKTVISSFGTDRKSQLIDKELVAEKSKLAPVKTVDDYNVKVIVTNDGYVKKLPLTSLRSNPEIQYKNGDFAVAEVDTNNTEEVLVFTDQQNVYKKQLDDLEDTKPKDLGNFMKNYVNLGSNENIIGIVPLSESVSSVLIGFDDGKVAKVSTEAYRTLQNRSVLKKAIANKTVLLLTGLTKDIDILSISTNGKAVLTNTSMISEKGSKTTQGVANQKLKAGDTIAEYRISPELENKEYYRIQSAGAGKLFK